MKIRKLIQELTAAAEEFGDVECLIEVVDEHVICMMPVGEVSFEIRNGYGESISLLQ